MVDFCSHSANLQGVKEIKTDLMISIKHLIFLYFKKIYQIHAEMF